MFKKEPRMPGAFEMHFEQVHGNRKKADPFESAFR